MPRRSAAGRAAFPIKAEHPRLQPPEFLDDLERELFREIIESCAPDHFVPSDVPLLVAYVQAVLLARGAIKEAATEKSALTIWDHATKAQNTLATRLRLCPQARAYPKTIGRHQPKNPHLRRPWDD